MALLADGLRVPETLRLFVPTKKIGFGLAIIYTNN
jgi:hypothetical protein